MTYEQAKTWLVTHKGTIQEKQSVEGAKTFDQAMRMKDLTFVSITVGNDMLEAVLGSPMVSQEVLVPFLVTWFIGAFGGPSTPVLTGK